jgi:hypothetical protein
VCKEEQYEQLAISRPDSVLGSWNQLCLKVCPIDNGSKPASCIVLSTFYCNEVARFIVSLIFKA